jgi:hypothetical protein
MKKIQVLGVALIALFAFGALTAMSASAATFLLAEWLLNGNPIAAGASDLVEVVGELLLTDLKGVLGSPAMVLCSGILVGTAEANSLDTVTEVLNLAMEPIGSLPSGLALSCVAQEGCETNTNPSVYPLGLPWESEAELMEDTTTFFADLLKTKANGGLLGWEITNCLVLGTSNEDSCTTKEGAAELKLNGTTLLGSFAEAFTALAGLKNATCEKGGENAGVVEGEGTYVVSGGGELTASSETAVS